MKSKYTAKIVESLQNYGLDDDDAQMIAARRLPLWPKGEKSEMTFTAANGVASIRIDGPIGIDFWTGEGITAKSIDEELKAAGKVNRIEIELNSGGGDAFEGINIHTLLSKQKAHVVVNINGLAASAASVLAMAGDEIRMAESAMLMIHDAYVGTIGNESEHIKVASILEKLDGQLAATYARKSGRPASEFRSLMDEETWLTPDGAMELGLADAVDAEMRMAACVFDLSAYGYKHPPKAEATATPEPVAIPLADQVRNAKLEQLKSRGILRTTPSKGS